MNPGAWEQSALGFPTSIPPFSWTVTAPWRTIRGTVVVVATEVGVFTVVEVVDVEVVEVLEVVVVAFGLVGFLAAGLVVGGVAVALTVVEGAWSTYRVVEVDDVVVAEAGPPVGATETARPLALPPRLPPTKYTMAAIQATAVTAATVVDRR
jgi:hypothetical protein